MMLKEKIMHVRNHDDINVLTCERVKIASIFSVRDEEIKF